MFRQWNTSINREQTLLVARRIIWIIGLSQRPRFAHNGLVGGSPTLLLCTAARNVDRSSERSVDTGADPGGDLVAI